MATLVMTTVLVMLAVLVTPSGALRAEGSSSDFDQGVANLTSFGSEVVDVEATHSLALDLPKVVVEVSSEIAEGRRGYFQIWIEKAQRWVGTAVRRLRSGRKTLVQWFKLEKLSKAEQDRVEAQVKERLIAMQHALENIYIETGTEENCNVEKKARGGSHGTLAYVYPRQRKMSTGAYVVHICPFASDFKGDSSTQTLVHEISHHMGTEDHAYGKKDCSKLPPQKATQNADTYSLFVYQLIGQKTLYEEGSGKPHAACNTACDTSSWEYAVGQSFGLDTSPALGECLQCSWKEKSTGIAGMANWMSGALGSDSTEDSCGDGQPTPRKIESGDCDQEGCEWIDSDSKCLEAAKSVGLSFSDITRGKRARSTTKPFGCWASSDTLFLNNDRKSKADASPSESMICMCPTAKEFGLTRLARACCTPYECQRPETRQ